MNATDFIYGGESLSSYGCMIASFDAGGSMSEIKSDSQRSVDNISLFNGKYLPFITTAYSDALSMSFEIIKDPDLTDDKKFTQNEIRMLKRWLNRANAESLYLLDDDYEGLHWDGIFNVGDMYFNGQGYALHLDFQTNRPFGLQEKFILSGSLTAGASFTIFDISDETGFVYPSLEITCRASGTLTLHNSYDDRSTIIENCTNNEVITFTPLLQVSSSVTAHKIYNDFNYQFLRIGNTYENRQNTISSTLPISYSLAYDPIAKVVAG